MTEPRIPLVILGPTATGKSDIAVRVARRIGGRVINADSIQVYRGLDAGSCKPGPRLREAVRHYLVDVADPEEPFSAGRFAGLAARAIEECAADGAVPIIAGGTGLYLRALLEGIAPMPPRDEAIRSRLYERAGRESPAALHEELRKVDPGSAARIGPNDLQRIVRALEVAEATGRPLSEHLEAAAYRPGHRPAVKVGLSLDRASLYGRIDRRVDAIFEAGIVQEVRRLLDAGLSPRANALKALGYRETCACLRGETELPEAIELTRRNTRRFARRQLRWFARDPEIQWLPAAPPEGGERESEALAGRIEAIYTAVSRGPCGDAEVA